MKTEKATSKAEEKKCKHQWVLVATKGNIATFICPECETEKTLVYG